MKKILTLIMLLGSINVYAQIVVETDTITVGNTSGAGGVSLFGKAYLKNIPFGTSHDSVLVRNANGSIRMVPRSSFGTSGAAAYLPLAGGNVTGTLSNTGITQWASGSRFILTVDETTARFRYNTNADIQALLGISGGPFVPLSEVAEAATGNTVVRRSGGGSIFANQIFAAGGQLSGDLTTNARIGIGNAAGNARLEVTQLSGEIFRADGASGALRIVADQAGVTFGGTATFNNYIDNAASISFPGAITDRSRQYYSASSGMVLYGAGSTNDVTLLNKNGHGALEVPTGTSNVVFGGSGTFPSTVFFNLPDANIRLKGGGNDATDGFIGVSPSGLLYFRNWAGTRGFTINTSNVLAHTGALSVGGSGTFAGNVIPNAHHTYDLGHSSYRWNYLYANSAFLSGALSTSGDGTFGGNVTGSNLNISNWNTAYGWGNHASAGYLTSGSLSSYLALTGGTLSGSLAGTSASFSGNITAGGDITANSDARLKKDIRPLDNITDQLRRLNAVSYRMKADNSLHIGFVAQEVEKQFPLLVRKADDAQGTLSVNYQALTAPLLKGWQEHDTLIQQQAQQIKTQAEQIRTQEERIAKLENALNKLENLLRQPVK